MKMITYFLSICYLNPTQEKKKKQPTHKILVLVVSIDSQDLHAVGALYVIH